MRLELKVIVEVDQEGYDLLKRDGYNDFQLHQRIVNNIRGVFSILIKHWDRSIYDITIEEVEKNSEHVDIMPKNILTLL
jgi:hypothetical protein